MDKIKIHELRQVQDGTIEYYDGREEKWEEISADDLYQQFVNLEHELETAKEEVDDLETTIENLSEDLREAKNEDLDLDDLPKLGKNLYDVDKLEILKQLFESCSREELQEMLNKHR